MASGARRRRRSEHCEQALRLKPDFAEAHYSLGVALEQAGKVSGGDGALGAGAASQARLSPMRTTIWGPLCSTRAGCRRRSRTTSRRCGSSPITPEAHNNLGVALAQVGRVQEAIGHFEQALRINPDFAEAHYNLGVALAQVGRVQEAIGHFEQALRLKPDFTEAQNKLAQLRAVQ